MLLKDLKWEGKGNDFDRLVSQVLIPLPRWGEEFPDQQASAYRVVKRLKNSENPGTYTVRPYPSPQDAFAGRHVYQGSSPIGAFADVITIAAFLTYMREAVAPGER